MEELTDAQIQAYKMLAAAILTPKPVYTYSELAAMIVNLENLEL